MSLIMGLSFDFHDSSAVLLKDGAIVAASQEERFSRKKNDPSFPAKAIDFCLRQGGVRGADLDAVVFYEQPLLKFDRIVSTALTAFGSQGQYLGDATLRWFAEGKFEVRKRIAAHLSVPETRVHFVGHHEAHAASAFFCSPFDEAVIVTFDAVGEHETTTVKVGRGSGIEPLYSNKLPHSLGLFYSALTAYLGFKVNEGEYKVMGLSAYGEPKYKDLLAAFIELHDDGMYTIKQELFHFLCPVDGLYSEGLERLLGPAKDPAAPFDLAPQAKQGHREELDSSTRRFADVAASLQAVAEDVIFHVVRKAMERTGLRNVCLAGGVALNSLANGKLQKALGCTLYVQPAAGDAGGALGAALHRHHVADKAPRREALTDIYLGEAYGDADMARELAKANLTPHAHFESDEAMLRAVAAEIERGAVVGWVQGRFEWGPRALGNRSILADPRREDMKEIINRKIKFREPFRPFAPSVLEERAHEYFDIPPLAGQAAPEFFMLAVCPVLPGRESAIPAVTHVDGTARIHVVSRAANPLYYGLIEEFGRLTGVPILLNTSFNLQGEPIVTAPYDALKTYFWSDMDCLVVGRYLLKKES